MLFFHVLIWIVLLHIYIYISDSHKHDSLEWCSGVYLLQFNISTNYVICKLIIYLGVEFNSEIKIQLIIKIQFFASSVRFDGSSTT